MANGLGRLRLWIGAAALAAGAGAGNAQAQDFCTDLQRVVAAAGETPPFASLGARPRVGEHDRCETVSDYRGRANMHCWIRWTISAAPLQTGPLAARARQCPGLRLRPLPAEEDGDLRFAVEGGSGVEVAVVTTGCQLCRGGENLLLVVHAPPRRQR